MNKKRLFLGVLFMLSAGCSLFGMSSVEETSYDVLVKDNKIEIRRYKSYIVAKTTISGDFKKAQSQGFRILASYIFGKNKAQQKINMTAPVIQKSEGEEISMTAPVLIAPASKNQDTKSWVMTFTMPSKYTLENLPKPEDQRVKIETVPSRLVAAYRFSGFWSESKNTKKYMELLDWLNKNKEYQAISIPMFAGYNPPWTLPFLRRNEILVDIKARD